MGHNVKRRNMFYSPGHGRGIKVWIVYAWRELMHSDTGGIWGAGTGRGDTDPKAERLYQNG